MFNFLEIAPTSFITNQNKTWNIQISLLRCITTYTGRQIISRTNFLSIFVVTQEAGSSEMVCVQQSTSQKTIILVATIVITPKLMRKYLVNKSD